MTLKQFTLIFLVSVIMGAGGTLLGKAINKPRYDRWQELSPHEHRFLLDCVKQQSYFVCVENVHQVRQLGIVP
jgi:hypothetical protein